VLRDSVATGARTPNVAVTASTPDPPDAAVGGPAAASDSASNSMALSGGAASSGQATEITDLPEAPGADTLRSYGAPRSRLVIKRSDAANGA
jgi:hypothetical protein